MKKFNLNSNVKVKLTKYGKERLKEANYTPYKEDADGWSEWQLYELMKQLGKYFRFGFHGSMQPMETNILIDIT